MLLKADNMVEHREICDLPKICFVLQQFEIKTEAITDGNETTKEYKITPYFRA